MTKTLRRRISSKTDNLLDSTIADLSERQRLFNTPSALEDDDQLFQIDTKGDQSLVSTTGTAGKKKNPVILHVDKVLAMTGSAIPAMHTNKKGKETSGESKILRRMLKKQVHGSKKIEENEDAEESLATTSQIYDMWATSLKGIKTESDTFNLQVTDKTKDLAVVQPRISATVRAISAPDNLESYHPDPCEHILKFAALEAKLSLKEKSIQKANLVTGDNKRSNQNDMVERANWELLNPLSDSESQGEATEAGSENAKLVSHKKQQHKKTQAQRNKQARHRATMRTAREARRKNVLLKQIDQLAATTATSTEVEGKRVSSALITQEVEQGIVNIPFAAAAKKVAGRRLTPSPIIAQMPHELPTSLRALVPSINPALDRYRSLCERAMVEPTTKALLGEYKKGKGKGGKFKKKKTFFISRSYKEEHCEL